MSGVRFCLDSSAGAGQGVGTAGLGTQEASPESDLHKVPSSAPPPASTATQELPSLCPPT